MHSFSGNRQTALLMSTQSIEVENEKKTLVKSGKEKGGLTSVRLNELVRYKNEVFLAAYSGLLTWLGKRRSEGGKRRRRTDNDYREKKSDPHPSLPTVHIK